MYKVMKDEHNGMEGWHNLQIMHIREVFWIFIKLPRVDNFTNDRSPNVHYLFYKMVSNI